MRSQDIEQLLESAKYKHLSDTTLVSYHSGQFEEAAVGLAGAHLRLCLICDRRLIFLKEEAEALTIIETPMARAAGYVQTEIARLSSNIKDLTAAWILPFSKEAAPGAGDGDEVWRYESGDGLLTARAVSKSDASLTIDFSSPEIVWEGTRIRFRLGSFSKEVTLQRKSSRVVARIEIPRSQRTSSMADLSIEVA